MAEAAPRRKVALQNLLRPERQTIAKNREQFTSTSLSGRPINGLSKTHRPPCVGLFQLALQGVDLIRQLYNSALRADQL